VAVDSDREVTVDVLAEGDGALLAVHHLVRAFVGDHPVHDVQRKALADGVDDGIPFLVVVNELALVLGTDVESAAVTDDTLLGAVEIALSDLTDGDFVQLDLHAGSPSIRRMTILSYRRRCVPSRSGT
jgi:hypothetical protein